MSRVSIWVLGSGVPLTVFLYLEDFRVFISAMELPSTGQQQFASCPCSCYWIRQSRDLLCLQWQGSSRSFCCCQPARDWQSELQCQSYQILFQVSWTGNVHFHAQERYRMLPLLLCPKAKHQPYCGINVGADNLLLRNEFILKLWACFPGLQRS